MINQANLQAQLGDNCGKCGGLKVRKIYGAMYSMRICSCPLDEDDIRRIIREELVAYSGKIGA